MRRTSTVAAAAGNEDTPIALNISASLVEDTTVDPDASLSITITGVPGDASLSAGHNNGGGSWTLTPAQLTGLTITPGSSTDAFTLTIDAKTTDGTATADTIKTLDVSVTPVADAPNLTVAAAAGNEDTPIALNISASLVEDTTVDPDASLSITITGVPGDASLSAGHNNGGGSWTLTPAQLTGLTIAPGSSTDAFTLTIDAKTTDGTATADTIKTLDVSVTPVADAPNLTVAAAAGNEDTPIALNISASLVEDTTVDPDASLSITITGVPGDASLSAGHNNGGGSWTLTPPNSTGLTITPGSSTDAFTLTIDAKTTDGTATADTIKTLDVSVTPVADAPNLTVAAAAGNEDTPIALNISASLVEDTTVDPDASLSITITGVPGDASLSAGHNNGGGSWTLTPAQLTGLTITPGSTPMPSRSPSTLRPPTAPPPPTPCKTLDVSVTPVADAPNLTVAAAAGNEDTPIALNISASLVEDTTVDPRRLAVDHHHRGAGRRQPLGRPQQWRWQLDADAGPTHRADHHARIEHRCLHAHHRR